MTPYPLQSEAVDAALKSGAILTSGAISSQRTELAYYLWIVQGHAQYRLIGDVRPTFGASAELTEADIAAFNSLYSSLADFAQLPQTYGGFLDKIDWKKLVELLIKIAPLFLDQT